ncbi:MAG TPA: NAD-dependent epimerase/dehydratase family protein, partial [Puia sp.]
MKIVVLGSDGFVGRNLLEGLAGQFECHGSTRRKVTAGETGETGETGEGASLPGRFYFDIDEPPSWEELLSIRPDCIVNCIGYGVVKTQTDVKKMFDVNYFHTARLYEYIGRLLPDVYLIHLGTAFEYHLQSEGLTERSECIPDTYYGAGKLLASQFVQRRRPLKKFTIIRPFNMFGPYEDTTKIIPALIRGQRL